MASLIAKLIGIFSMTYPPCPLMHFPQDFLNLHFWCFRHFQLFWNQVEAGYSQLLIETKTNLIFLQFGNWRTRRNYHERIQQWLGSSSRRKSRRRNPKIRSWSGWHQEMERFTSSPRPKRNSFLQNSHGQFWRHGTHHLYSNSRLGLFPLVPLVQTASWSLYLRRRQGRNGLHGLQLGGWRRWRRRGLVSSYLTWLLF